MKRLLIAFAGTAGVIALVLAANLLWNVFGPSVIVIHNVGDQSARLVLTDADHSTQVWSGDLEPSGRKTAMVWFKHEGAPELHCRDQTSSTTAELGYVTGFMPLNAEIAIAGCDRINQSYR